MLKTKLLTFTPIAITTFISILSVSCQKVEYVNDTNEHNDEDLHKEEQIKEIEKGEIIQHFKNNSIKIKLDKTQLQSEIAKYKIPNSLLDSNFEIFFDKTNSNNNIYLYNKYFETLSITDIIVNKKLLIFTNDNLKNFSIEFYEYKKIDNNLNDTGAYEVTLRISKNPHTSAYIDTVKFNIYGMNKNDPNYGKFCHNGHCH